MRFFPGIHQPADAKHFPAVFVSINRICDRKSPFEVGDWIMDSGAFTKVSTDGDYTEEPEVYAAQIRRWAANGNLLAAVSQDYMCEPFILAITGKTIPEHQQLTIDRYDRILAAGTDGVYLMPVLQGFESQDYVDHIRQYGDRLAAGAWVGVGSVCKRNGNVGAIEAVLHAIKTERPDLRLHGFGLKTTALSSGTVLMMLETADSMAWSYKARIEGRNGNDWREAQAWSAAIHDRPIQWPLFNPPGARHADRT